MIFFRFTPYAKQTNHKRLLAAILLLAAVFLLCGCDAQQPSSSQTQAPSAAQTAEEPDTASSADEAAALTAAPNAPTLTQAQTALDSLGFAVLSAFSAPDEIPLARLFYGVSNPEHTGAPGDFAALEALPAVQRICDQMDDSVSAGDLMRNLSWFRRHETDEMRRAFQALTGAEMSAAQLSALTTDAQFPWGAASGDTYYAIGSRLDMPQPVACAVEAAAGGWAVAYTLGHTSAEKTVYYTGVAYQDGHYLDGGTLTLDASGNVVANAPSYALGAEQCCAALSTGFAAQLTSDQTQALLQALEASGADTLLTQRFSMPEALDLQALLQSGLLPQNGEAAQIRDALGRSPGGTFDAHTPDEIKAAFFALTGVSPSQAQWTSLTSWSYSEQFGVYCGYVTDPVSPVTEAAAYRMPNGSVVLAYAQASGTSFSGVCLLHKTDGGWRMSQNIRF